MAGSSSKHLSIPVLGHPRPDYSIFTFSVFRSGAYIQLEVKLFIEFFQKVLVAFPNYFSDLKDVPLIKIPSFWTLL